MKKYDLKMDENAMMKWNTIFVSKSNRVLKWILFDSGICLSIFFLNFLNYKMWMWINFSSFYLFN